MFAHQTNVDVHNRLIAYGIRDLGKQLRMPGMLVMTDAIRNRVAQNRERGVRTHIFLDEMHIFFSNELSPCFSRNRGTIPQGRRAGDRHHAERRGLP